MQISTRLPHGPSFVANRDSPARTVLPMLPLILVDAAAIVWSVLTAVGVRRGLRGRVVVIRSWSDCALTAVVAVLLVIDLITCRRSADDIQIIRVLTLVAGLPWLWKTRMANQSAQDLWVVVPAKLTLVFIAAIFAAALLYPCGFCACKTACAWGGI